MSTLNISLPQDLKAVVDREVKRGGFASHSEYIRALIRNEQQRIARENVEELLLSRLDGEPASEMTAADWRHIRQEVLKRVARRRGKR
jgi:antitoxin ParD1/3/4